MTERGVTPLGVADEIQFPVPASLQCRGLLGDNYPDIAIKFYRTATVRESVHFCSCDVLLALSRFGHHLIHQLKKLIGLDGL
jgi:hypothetical protein